MMLVITVTRSVEPEFVEAWGVYKIQSGNYSLVETPAHTHLIPAFKQAAPVLKNLSLRNNRRSIRHSCKQSQRISRHVV